MCVIVRAAVSRRKKPVFIMIKTSSCVAPLYLPPSLVVRCCWGRGFKSCGVSERRPREKETNFIPKPLAFIGPFGSVVRTKALSGKFGFKNLRAKNALMETDERHREVDSDGFERSDSDGDSDSDSSLLQTRPLSQFAMVDKKNEDTANAGSSKTKPNPLVGMTQGGGARGGGGGGSSGGGGGGGGTKAKLPGLSLGGGTTGSGSGASGVVKEKEMARITAEMPPSPSSSNSSGSENGDGDGTEDAAAPLPLIKTIPTLPAPVPASGKPTMPKVTLGGGGGGGGGGGSGGGGGGGGAGSRKPPVGLLYKLNPADPQLVKAPGFNPSAYDVKTRFQAFALSNATCPATPRVSG
jgi:hypothetical protein